MKIIEKLKQIKNLKEIILYVVFGAATTVINVVAYYLCYNVSGISNTVSVVIAWVLSVLFAFLTNRGAVFHSTAVGKAEKGRELLSFFFYRAVTGVADWLIMYIAVDVCNSSGIVWKIISN
ncbi:MAG: GtrA family protein, partial [Clostridiales bacterium]|nr:GtrA family protein [Candidatus Equinaster intestinalis]